MFSTFTGNSRRPRNVNLSGQTGNPFANTSWSPSQASSATKTVSEAQAGREKRQAERERVKAAGKIQRVWRGHSTRESIYEQRRAAFDDIYSRHDIQASQRPALCLNLLVSFFIARRQDDLQRVVLLIRDAGVSLAQTLEPRFTQRKKLLEILVAALNALADDRTVLQDLQMLLQSIRILSESSPGLHYSPSSQYYSALAKLARFDNPHEGWTGVLLDAVEGPLQTDSSTFRQAAYESLVFHFLTRENIHVFEDNIGLFGQRIQTNALSEVILDSYRRGQGPEETKDQLLQLAAHYIALGRESSASRLDPLYLDASFTQLSALSAELHLRLDIKMTETSRGKANGHLPSIHPYVAKQFSSLVDHDGISALLRDFSSTLAASSEDQTRSASVLAGYILALLQTFRSNADETRMRLFLEQIETSSGKIPLVRLLWEAMRQSSVFKKLRTETQRPVLVIQNYLRNSGLPSQSNVEEQEWRVILLFLETYNFVLLLSDDEDFFSGIQPKLIESPNPSRLRASSLSFPDVEALTVFLKNTAFALYYNAETILRDVQSSSSNQNRALTGLQTPSPSKLEFDKLRTIVTTTLKMLYERDSRKQFLPADHWLMTDKLDQQGFVSAVIAEEERQLEEAEKGSDDEEGEEEDEYAMSSEPRPYYSSHVARHMNIEKLRAQQLRAQKERRLAELGPKLEILKHMPFVVPFETRASLFQQFINLDQHRRQDGMAFEQPWGRNRAVIRRGHMFEDAYKEFYKLGDAFKDQISISFVDQFGKHEAGIDGGGVGKEFLTRVTAEAFASDSETGWFTSNEKGLLYPNPMAIDQQHEAMRAAGMDNTMPQWRENLIEKFKRYEFLGRMVGKCLYEGILVDLVFAGFFLLKWPSTGPGNENTYKGSINDLRDLDEELYNGLLKLKNFPGDVSELGIDFTISDPVAVPGRPLKTITRNLIPNGDQITVNNDNRPLYISYAARHRLVSQPYTQTRAFLQGLRSIIRPHWLSMFNQSELQRLIGGDSREIDVDDLRANTVCSGLYQVGDDGLDHPTIELFWKVVRKFTDAERRNLLWYVTSTPRAPLLGFSQLKPKFSIRDSSNDQTRLPSTSTCVNLLKLPLYTSEEALREKLLYAITSGAGFDLS